MTTTKIKLTDGVSTEQRKQIGHILEKGISTLEFDNLGLTEEEVLSIIEKGEIMQQELKELVIGLLKKHAIIDHRFGAAIAEFDLTVPSDYHHDRQIDSFSKIVKKEKSTYQYVDEFNCKNFGNTTFKLIPGKTYRVKIYPILKRVKSEDCMNFIEQQKGILVGGQGITLAYSLHKDYFPVGRGTVSLDQPHGLWKDSNGKYRAPIVRRYSDGYWKFYLGDLELHWSADNCLICFFEK